MSETKAIYLAGQHTFHTVQLLSQLQIVPSEPVKVYSDNDGTVSFANGNISQSKMRGLEIKYHQIKKWVERNYFTFEQINTEDNNSDMMTQLLPPALFIKHRDSVRLSLVLLLMRTVDL
jgi:hypothetical protein